MSYTRQKPRRLKASRPVPAVVLDHTLAGKIRIYRRKHRGQAAIIIALCSILLIAVVGLAVDGGSAYTERRKAQNAADAAAMGGTTLMLKQYEVALMDPANNGDLPGTAAQEDAIYAKIQDFVRTNGAITSTIETYFVDRNKGIVTVPIGEDRGQGHCGASRPCQVGENGQVPWTRGAIGITVKARSQTGSFFMGVLGWDNASAAARATAFMGVSATTGDISVQPIALFREPDEFDEIRFGQTYTLLDGDVTQGSGNWGWITWNGDGSASTTAGWIKCGFNPGVTAATWAAWCPSASNANGYGPTKHYRSATTGDYLPETNPTWVSYLKFGPGASGWWLEGSSGAVNSNCRDFWDRAFNESTQTPDGLGIYLYFPIFDRVVGSSSSDLRYHLRVIANFFVRKPVGTYNNPDPSSDVSCKPIALPTPTYCAIPCPVATATPAPSGNNIRWFVRGKAKNFYDSSSSGELGDIRYAFGRTVFLDN